MGSHRVSRIREIAPGVGVLAVVAVVVCGSIYGWHLLPGLLGEWVGFIVGLMTTPFLLELSFLCLGLILVMAINHWRRSRDGDDFVVLEQVKDSEVSLPEHASWAVFRDDAPPGETPSLLAQAEGALAVGDFDATGGLLAEMSTDELQKPETLRLRIRFATETGNRDLAAKLQRELHDEERNPTSASPEHK